MVQCDNLYLEYRSSKNPHPIDVRLRLLTRFQYGITLLESDFLFGAIAIINSVDTSKASKYFIHSKRRQLRNTRNTSINIGSFFSNNFKQFSTYIVRNVWYLKLCFDQRNCSDIHFQRFPVFSPKFDLFYALGEIVLFFSLSIFVFNANLRLCSNLDLLSLIDVRFECKNSAHTSPYDEPCIT